MHKTTAWPLALVYVGLVVYASLYPFEGWRDQGLVPWLYLWAPWPQYWTWFDLGINVLGYIPLGFLIAVSGLRSGRVRAPAGRAWLLALALSFLMESLQSYLPQRVPSNVDLLFNSLGGLLGGVLAIGMQRWGALLHWQSWRSRWFSADARGALVLLALWPVGLLFPAAVPLGLGQVLERLTLTLNERLQDASVLDWLPVPEMDFEPLVPGAVVLCVALGVLIPCLLGFSILRRTRHRLVCVALLLGCGIAVTALSAALSYGPSHAWAWLSVPVQAGLALGGLLALTLLGLSVRSCALLMLLGLGVDLSVLNQAPTSAYFAQTLHTWEQGRFIRFHGLAQWVGWLWPYATLIYVLQRFGGHASEN